ncbi:hypothetical protein [Winogradskyella schleiferi]|uniref:hypothetical protein n=1 Tax=Winogradskyella schleiferi TaxID=2686078 RepID=UPI0015BE8652|nr:hypothetical protein [Winogradskyella schleiferi]
MILKVTYKLTALFLTFVLLANNINNVVIVTDFLINQDFIAKTLCIQKEEQKGCNGKCHLTKQLVKNNTASNSDTPMPTTDRTRLDVFVVNAIANHKVEDFYHVRTLQHPLHYRIKAPNSGFYSIPTPPPDLS